MTECIELTNCGEKTEVGPLLQVQPEGFRYFCAEKAEGCSGIYVGGQPHSRMAAWKRLPQLNSMPLNGQRMTTLKTEVSVFREAA